MTKGFFITFEGGEGTGKTTQIELLKDYLLSEGNDVFVTREPGGLEISEEIREVILKQREEKTPKMNIYTELLLFLAARAHFYEHVILPNLNEGKIVLSDRSYDSSMVYQGYARGLDVELIESLNKKVTSNVVPDITFFLDIDPEIGIERVKGRGELNRLDAEKIDFHHRVRAGYRKIAEKEKDRVVTVDAKNDIDTVHKDIKTKLYSKLKVKT